jgi:hypothetical protein
MTVRDPGFNPRRPQRRRRGSPGSSPQGRFRWAAVLAVVALLLAVGVPFGGGLLGAPDGSGPPAGSPGAASPDSPRGTDGAGNVPTPTARPTPTPEPTPALARVPIVPVTHFRSPLTSTGNRDLAAVGGENARFKSLVLVERDADAILDRLDLDRAALGTRLVTVESASALAEDMAANRNRLGFLRADEVTPAVRTLAWGDDALFGVHRVAGASDWPLHVEILVEPGGPARAGYDPATAWTLVAGGDILLDRGVSLTIREQKRGADFPFDGGTVEITSRYCCSSFGWVLPRTKRTGNGGIVRELLQGADLAIANFENPAPKNHRFHSRGTIFHANPKHIAGIRDAGIDWLSLANNHIGDAQRRGMVETMEHLDEYGIAYGGLGRSLAEARKPSLLEAGGVTVAILAYDAIAQYYWAGPETTGSAPLKEKYVVEDVEAARAAGADVVIVFPHWGVEYRATPSASQVKIARAAIDAGADMVFGNHAHWAGALEVYEGKPIWYALGNFVFDQTWSEPTMEGIILELTFNGPELVQVNMRPHLILDRAQPNFLDPAGDGKIVMDQVFKASKNLDW